MMERQMEKEKTILIVDDIEVNRALLAENFKDDYEIETVFRIGIAYFRH